MPSKDRQFNNSEVTGISFLTLAFADKDREFYATFQNKAGVICCLGPPRSRYQDRIRCEREILETSAAKDKPKMVAAGRTAFRSGCGSDTFEKRGGRGKNCTRRHLKLQNSSKKLWTVMGSSSPKSHC